MKNFLESFAPYKYIVDNWDWIKWVFRLYFLTVTIPLILTLIWLISVVLGIPEMQLRNPDIIDVWIKYYYNGSFIDVIAWKWHLVIFMFCIVINVIDNKIN